MKKALITIVLVFILGLSSFTQETKAAFGYGAEMNKNAEYGVGGGALLNFDVNLFSQYAIGASVTMSGDNSYNGILETAVMVRRYFLPLHEGFFVEVDTGLSIFTLRDEKTFYRFLAGVRGGYRLPFGNFFYVEPCARVGYPFIFGVGTVAGYRR